MSRNLQAAGAPAQAAASAELDFDGKAGAALHQRRRRLGLTTTEVARRVGITQRQMARLELGLEPLTLRLAVALGAVLGMPPGWFMGLEAAAMPDAIGLALQEMHDRWASHLLTNLVAAAGQDTPH